MSGDFIPSSRIGGDIARMRATIDQRRRTGDSVEPVDFEELLVDFAASEPTGPDLLARTDGVGLFYRGEWSEDELTHSAGRVNCLYGDREAGKTMVALGTAARELARIADDEHDCDGVLFLDTDGNDPLKVAAILRMLGVPTAMLTGDVFQHYRPRDAVEVLDAVRQFISTKLTGLAIIEGVDEVLSLFGADPNKGDDVSAVLHAVCDPLVEEGHGVLLIDHTARSSDGRGPSGSVVKQRLITGTLIEVRPARRLVPGRGGELELFVVKERDGILRSKCPDPGQPRQLAGTFVLDPPGPDGVAPWRVESPWPTSKPEAMAGATDWPAAVAGMVGPFGVDQLVIAATGSTAPTRSQREMARRAIKDMVANGALKQVHEGGGRGNPTTWEAP